MVSPYYSVIQQLTTFLSHRPLESDDLFSCRLLTATIFLRRLSSVLSKSNHKNNFIRVSLPQHGVTRGGPPHPVTPLN